MNFFSSVSLVRPQLCRNTTYAHAVMPWRSSTCVIVHVCTLRVGEFNAGKSSLINALLGARHLDEGVTPTTDHVYLIKQSQDGNASGTGRRGITGAIAAIDRSTPPTVIELPVPWLKDVTLVDTPGTNAIMEGHAEITEAIIPVSSALVWFPSSQRGHNPELWA